MSAPTEVVIVDDHSLFVRGLELVLPDASGGRLTVTGATNDATQAAGLVRRCRPDVALVDLAMPTLGGLRAIAAILRTEPVVPIVALSGTDDEDVIREAFLAGASAFLPKTAEPGELVGPLLAVVDGWAVLPPVVLFRLLGRTTPAAGRARGDGRGSGSGLRWRWARRVRGSGSRTDGEWSPRPSTP